MKILSLKGHLYAPAISILSIVLAIATLMVGMVGCGGGSPPIEIRTWYDLSAVRNNLTANYVLMKDLNSTTPGYTELASPTANGGKGWDPIGGHEFGNVFWGSFDGYGHKICDLFINRPDEKDVGLFGTVGQGGILKGVIKNLGVVNFTVTGNVNVAGLVGASYVANTVANCYATGTVTGNEVVGGLVGFIEAGGIVSISYFTGSVTGSSQVGGLMGGNEGGIVSDCCATGTVTGGNCTGGLVGWSNGTVMICWAIGSVTGSGLHIGGLVGGNQGTVTDSYSSANVTGGSQAGGLVGTNSGGTLNNSYATGNVTGDNFVGGLMGVNGWGSNLSNSYSIGGVAGYSSVGGLVGENHYDSTVSNSFWDMETSGQNISAGGTAKNTTEMKDIATFSGATWNIIAVANPDTRNPSYIWNIVDDVTYPFLNWQPV